MPKILPQACGPLQGCSGLPPQWKEDTADPSPVQQLHYSCSQAPGETPQGKRKAWACVGSR